jgi:uncharacterized membrane protein
MQAINWIAGAIAFVIFFAPMAAILYYMHQSNKKIDQEYKERIAEIEKRYRS